MPDLDSTTDLCRVLGDASRVRLLSLLAEEELSVAELVQVTGLSQSRISTHLARLRDAGFVRDRREGGFTYYSLDEAMIPLDAARLWNVVQRAATDSLLEQDQARLLEVVEAREGRSWADGVAGCMARHYSPGRSWEATLRAIMGLLQLGRVLDVASGDGAMAELLAPRARSVTCLDASVRVVTAGRRRLAHLVNVDFQRGDMHELPFAEAAFDQVLLLNALQYAQDPAKVVGECARVLAPGGALVIVALARHAHASLVASYGHVHMGFEVEELAGLLARSELEVSLCERTSRERRPPHFEILTAHARRTRAG